MPWKPIHPEARARMEDMMPPSMLPYRAAMPHETLEQRALRLALHEVLDGEDPTSAAASHGVAIERLLSAMDDLGRQRHKARPARRNGTNPDRRKLSFAQESAIHGLIRAAAPDMIGGAERLWSREGVRLLVARETGLHLPERTLSSYLERWGFAPEKPLRAMAARHPARMREWLKRDYPVIAMLAREAEGRVAWWGHAPLLARQQGKLPPGTKAALVDSPLWQAGRFSLLFITGNRGHARWQVQEGAPTAAMVIDFLERYLCDEPRGLFLIMPADALFLVPEFVAWAALNKERVSLHLFGPEATAHR